MKHEWRKQEKAFYLPKNKPERLYLPAFGFFTIQGQGNPNSDFFGEYIGVLYSLAYAVKMSPKKDMAPKGYFEYTIYPLEGVWDLTEEGRKKYSGGIDKNELVFTLMIRQPTFVDEVYARQIIEYTQAKKPNDLLAKVAFESIEEGACVQMLHTGPYDDEPGSFQQMMEFCEKEHLHRASMLHREIYLTDARKTAPEKLKTVLRFQVGMNEL